MGSTMFRLSLLLVIGLTTYVHSTDYTCETPTPCQKIPGAEECAADCGCQDNVADQCSSPHPTTAIHVDSIEECMDNCKIWEIPCKFIIFLYDNTDENCLIMNDDMDDYTGQCNIRGQALWGLTPNTGLGMWGKCKPDGSGCVNDIMENCHACTDCCSDPCNGFMLSACTFYSLPRETMEMTSWEQCEKIARTNIGGGTEQEEESQISLLENQVDLQAQQLADPKNKNKKSAGKKKKGRKTKRKRGKKRRGKKKSKKSKKRGKKKSKRNRRKGRKGNRKKKGKGKKRGRKNKRRNRVKVRKSKRLNKHNSRNATGGSSVGACETGCSDLLVGMMKAARKQNTYLKQFNRIVNGQKQSKKKGLKKDNFDSNATDGPLNLLISAGGGNKSEMTCAGSKTNKAALLMANLTAKLEACKTDLATQCNVSKFATIKPEWTACNTSMLEFKTESDNCMKLSGAAVCECFNTSKVLDIKKKVDNCSGTEMQKASISDGKLKKLCIKTYGACRQGGESIRPVLSACQAGGPTESEMKAQLGNTLKNEAATEAVEAKIDANIKAAGRKTSMVRRSVSIGGTSFALDTCALWATAVAAWLDALAAALATDISSAGTTIAGVTVTCTASDAAALNSAKSKATAVKKKIAKKKKMLQSNLEKTTGSTISADAAQAHAASVASASGGSGSGAATKAGRRRHQILAEFRQRF